MESEKQITVLDPTSLTTQQLWREIASLKELLFNEIGAIKDAIKIAHDDLVRVPTDVQKQVGALRELIFQKISDEHILEAEKFKKVDQRFELVETARLEQKTDAKFNVETALASARQLVELQNNNNIIAANKTEAAFNKLIDQQSNVTSSIQKGLYDQLDEIKNVLQLLRQWLSGH